MPVEGPAAVPVEVPVGGWGKRPRLKEPMEERSEPEPMAVEAMEAEEEKEDRPEPTSVGPEPLE